MRKFRIEETMVAPGAHIASPWVPEATISRGGVAFLEPGEIAHKDGLSSHPEPEFFLILHGRGFIELDDRRVPMTEGDVAIVECNELHNMGNDGESLLVALWLHFV